MLLFSSILGVILSLILLRYNIGKNRSAVYLGMFFLLISLYIFYQYVLLYSGSVILVEIMLAAFIVVTPPLYLIGPVLYWYVRSTLTDNFRLKKHDIWHLLPMFIFIIASFQFMFVPLSEKAELAHRVVNDVGFMQVYEPTFLSKLLTIPVMYLARPFLVLSYTFWSFFVLIRYSYRKKISGVLIKQRFMKYWLILLLGSLLLLVFTQILLIRKVFYMHFSELAFALNFLRVVSISSLILLLISPFFFPAILYGLPRIPDTSGNTGDNSCATEKNNNHSHNHYEEKYLQCIGEKIEHCMKSTEPYLQTQFNITQLSVQTGIPAHHLGYYFREVKKESFTDYRNRWRRKKLSGG